MLQDVVTPRGPYRLALSARRPHWLAPLVSGVAEAWQLADGRVVVRAPDEEGVARARFMLALDDDTTEFHARFARDPLLGASCTRARRLPPATHGHGGSCRAARVLRPADRVVPRTRTRAPHRAGDGRGAGCNTGRPGTTEPCQLRAQGLAQHRATGLVRLVRSIDLERLRHHPTEVVRARLLRERAVGPWSVGVVALEGLGRYDHGLVGDLGLVKIATSLWGRTVEGWETAELLAPYGEWQGLAGELLLLGAVRGLVPGVNPDAARLTRVRARRAA